MFKRKVYDELTTWKTKWAGKYAVLLEGARRVGKSTIAKTFAEENYDSYILVDFSFLDNELRGIFEDIANLDLFFLKLQNHFETKLFPRKSVIIFDEIQLYPKARQAIKHLVADGRYDYIETGSLISIKKNVENILIPSEEKKINVYPLDYEEFCWATKQDYELLKEAVLLNKPLNSLNRTLMRNFRIYMAVGGMPQAVDAYIKKLSFEDIDEVKREIIELYKSDFAKIDPSGRLADIYGSIPSQLSLKKNRFSLRMATGKKKTSKDERLLYDLIDSKTVLPCYRVTEPRTPLNLTKDFDSYKLYLSDIGLFTTLLFKDSKTTKVNIYEKLLSNKLDANLGYLYENVVAQILKSAGRDLYYFIWKNDPKSRPYEIDFLLSDGHKIIPIEVKSSEIKNHSSINEFSRKYSNSVSRRMLFSQNDFGHDEMLELKPVYALPIILDELNNK